MNLNDYIFVVRGMRVMVDSDLAALYGVETSALNRAVKRNLSRFPVDFAFQLSQTDWKSLMCQIGISKRGRGGRQKLPWVFTEQGVAMLSSVLRSPRAIEVNIEIMRAFVNLRKVIGSQKKITKELSELKSFLLKHSKESTQEFRKVWEAIEKLSISESSGHRKIGFDLN